MVPKQFRWTFPKIAFGSRFRRKKVKCPLREAADGRTDVRTEYEPTHDEHEKFEGLYTIPEG